MPQETLPPPSRAVKVLSDGKSLEGDLCLSPHGKSMVLFAHGSGSSRLSPRNQFVAKVLQQAGIGTLLFDLLTPEEDRDYETRFNIGLLTQRLMGATIWLKEEIKETLRMGYFGASTGAAAALWAAAEIGAQIKAVVSRGGRPDLAMPVLHQVQSPTLLIVGGLDPEVIQLNEKAYHRLMCPKELTIIPGATHLFEESGKLEEVSDLAREWFKNYLS